MDSSKSSTYVVLMDLLYFRQEADAKCLRFPVGLRSRLSEKIRNADVVSHDRKPTLLTHIDVDSLPRRPTQVKRVQGATVIST